MDSIDPYFWGSINPVKTINLVYNIKKKTKKNQTTKNKQ